MESKTLDKQQRLRLYDVWCDTQIHKYAYQPCSLQEYQQFLDTLGLQQSWNKEHAQYMPVIVGHKKFMMTRIRHGI